MGNLDAWMAMLLVAPCLFAGMLLFLELGRRYGARQLTRFPHAVPTGTAGLEGAVFALLGLLIAFSFYGAAERFDDRRQLIIQETNLIATAFLRLDVLPASHRESVKDLFRR